MGPSLCRVLILTALAAVPAARATALGSPQPSQFDASLLDWSNDPCIDFYAFTCSRWLGANPLPAEEVAWGTSSPLNLWSKDLLRQTLEDAARPDPGRTPHQRLIGDAWAACMDEPGIERAGLSPIKPDLDRIARLKDKRALAREIALLHLALPGAAEMGNNGTDAALFGFGSTPDFADAQTTVLMVDQCQAIRPEFARVIVRTNPHSLHEYRVNYVMSNQPEFREAFSCPAGKPMARAGACRVW